MWMTRISIANPVFATTLTIALLVMGAIAYTRLPVDRNPNVESPYVQVNTRYPGASPQTMESEITAVVEAELRGLAGVRSIESTSSEGNSQISLEFEFGVDPATALQEVRDKLAPLRFARDVVPPHASRTAAADAPIFRMSVSSASQSALELTELIDRTVLPALQSVPGVARASRNGGTRQEIQVLVDAAALRALGLGVDDVIGAISRENQTFPVGRIAQARSETLVTLEGKLQDASAFGGIIVAQRAGAPVRLADVARVQNAEKERTGTALADGEPVFGVRVQKSRDANTVEVADGVRRALDELAQVLPADVRILVNNDDSEAIRESLADVRKTLWEGAALTIAVVFLFLQSWRSTVITGLALPISIIGTFAALHALGVGINTMTLLALSLSIGILVDDAIVVRENIVRHIALGASHRRAALEATEEIGLAVLATTATIVAVFLPVAFMGGSIGQYFRDFGITVSVAVILSLLVSFTLDPMLSSIWPDPSLHGGLGSGRLARALSAPSRWLDALAGPYCAALRWSLAHRAAVVGIAVLSCAAAGAIFPLLGSEFMPRGETRQIAVELAFPEGSTLAYNEAKTRQVDAAVRELPEVEVTYAYINAGGGQQATIYARLPPGKQRVHSISELQGQLRTRLAQIGGAEISLGGGWGGRPIEVRILGNDHQLLDQLAQRAAQRMRQVQGVVDVSAGEQDPVESLAVHLDRERASELGLDLASVGTALQALVGGRTVTTWEAPSGERRDVVVRLPSAQRASAADLEQLPLSSGLRDAQGLPRLVPLRDVAQIAPSVTPRSIQRRDLRRQIKIGAGVQGRPAGDASRDIKAALAELELPPGYTFEYGGESARLDETNQHVGVALALGVLFIYLILASQFGSFAQPLAIMATLPLSLLGVFGALLVAGSTINLYSTIGFLMLMGLVTKNGILLVDFIQRGLEQGKSHLEASLEAGSVRLRPIAMTTAAMIFGMLPLAFAGSEDERAPMAHAVVGGLLSSALLTLVVVPVLHSLIHQLGEWIHSRRPAVAHGDGGAAAVAGAAAGAASAGD